MRGWWCALAAVTLLAAGCGDDEASSAAPAGGEQPDGEPAEQPGADDPTARQAARAGTAWYPGTKAALDAKVDGLLADVGATPAPARAVLVPHASLKYSGHVQAAAYARVEAPDVAIVLASDHDLAGEALAIWTEGPWLVPGYALYTEQEAAASLMAAFPELKPDRAAFDNHPPELQMPFLARLNPALRLVVIAFHDNSRNDFKGFSPERTRALGAALADVIRELEADGQRVLIAATTDLIHYEPLADAERQHDDLLGYIEALDVEGLHAYVTAESTSICGEVPTAVMMATVEALGATPADVEEVARDTSASINSDEEAVVGYTGVVIWR